MDKNYKIEKVSGIKYLRILVKGKNSKREETMQRVQADYKALYTYRILIRTRK